MPASQQIDELAKALAAAQQEMDFARKDSNNPFFKSSYADLAAVWEVCRAVLPKNGLAVCQTIDHVSGNPVVVTTLMHASGQWISGECCMPLSKQDPQAVGSAITYARRYSLAAIVGVIADDDDGEAAMDRGENKQQQKPRQPARSAPKFSAKPADPLAIINTAPTLDALKHAWMANNAAWRSLPNFPDIEAAKDARKAELEAA